MRLQPDAGTLRRVHAPRAVRTRPDGVERHGDRDLPRIARASRCGSTTRAAPTSVAASDASAPQSSAVRPSPGNGARAPIVRAWSRRAATSVPAASIAASSSGPTSAGRSASGVDGGPRYSGTRPGWWVERGRACRGSRGSRAGLVSTRHDRNRGGAAGHGDRPRGGRALADGVVSRAAESCRGRCPRRPRSCARSRERPCPCRCPTTGRATRGGRGPARRPPRAWRPSCRSRACRAGSWMRSSAGMPLCSSRLRSTSASSSAPSRSARFVSQSHRRKMMIRRARRTSIRSCSARCRGRGRTPPRRRPTRGSPGPRRG